MGWTVSKIHATIYFRTFSPYLPNLANLNSVWCESKI